MKRTFLIVTLFALTTVGYSQKKSGGLLGGVKDAINKVKGGSSSSLSNDEIVQGLREALSVGATNSSNKISVADGFFKDAAIKILLPQQVQKVEKKMRLLGMGKMVDNAV